MQSEIKELHRENEALNAKIAAMKTESLVNDAKRVGKFLLFTGKLGSTPAEARSLCDTLKAKYPDSVAVFATVSGDTLNFVASAGAEAVKSGAHAGNILREISAICNGRGGGRPDSAMSGCKDVTKLDEALAMVEKILGK